MEDADNVLLIDANCIVGREPHPYDLLWPVARRQEKAAIGRIDEMNMGTAVFKPGRDDPLSFICNPYTFIAKPTGSLTSVRSYAQHLLSGKAEIELEPLTDETGDGGALSGCREAVEITTRNPKKSGLNCLFEKD